MSAAEAFHTTTKRSSDVLRFLMVVYLRLACDFNDKYAV